LGLSRCLKCLPRAAISSVFHKTLRVVSLMIDLPANPRCASRCSRS
jgi:hypothetical protein